MSRRDQQLCLPTAILLCTLLSTQLYGCDEGAEPQAPAPMAGVGSLEPEPGGEGGERPSPVGGALGGSMEPQGGAVELSGAEAGHEVAGEVGGEVAGETPPPLSFEERLVVGLPVGPDRSLYDCRAAEDWVAPERDFGPGCVLDLSCERRMIVGHRGVGGDLGYLAPENSLSAIRAALLLGLDGVELDVRASADDGLVVIHDSSVDRTTEGGGLVEEMSLAELTALPLSPPALSHPNITGGDFSCERVPTLRQALLLTRGRLFVDLDMKTSRVELVIPILVELGLLDEVYISVSNPEVAARARALEPRVRVQVRPDSLEELEALEPLFEGGRGLEVIEVPSSQLELFIGAVEARGARLFTDAWGADLRGAMGSLEAYQELFERGAHIIQCELPLLALEALGRAPRQD